MTYGSGWSVSDRGGEHEMTAEEIEAAKPSLFAKIYLFALTGLLIAFCGWVFWTWLTTRV